MEIVERQPFLDTLNELLVNIQSQALSSQLVLVSGEAGIGKTALVRHFTQNAGAPVLWGMCDPLTTPRPLAPLLDILEQTGSELLHVLESSADRFPVFSGFLNELRQKSSTTIVVFEDVHWADSATLDLIKYLGRRIQQTSSLMILTYRDDEIDTNHPLQAVVGDLSRLDTVRRMTLPPLSAEAVAALTSDTELQPEVVYRLTNGNPFFVTELLADDQHDQVPVTIRDAVLARKSHLSLSAQSVLETAAVIGARTESWLLAETVSAESSAIAECLSSGILQIQAGVYIFRHELSRQAVFDSIPPHHRQVLHQQVLDVLESSAAGDKDVARLAYHAEGARDAAKLKRYALAAAGEARTAGAFHIATEQYQRVFKAGVSIEAGERADLLEAYAQACTVTDRIEESITANLEALTIWRDTGNREREGAGLSKLARCYFISPQPDAADQASLEAIAILESLDTPLTLAAAYGTEAMLRMLNRDVEDAVRWGWKSFKIAEQFQDATVMSTALNSIGSAMLFIDYERGCELLTQSLDIAREANIQINVSAALGNLASGSGELHQFHKAEHYALKGLAFAAEYDMDNHYQYLTSWLALVYLYRGKWSAAADAAWEVLNSRTVASYSRIMALLALGRLRTRRGDPGAAELLDEALELAMETKHLQRIAPAQCARAEMFWYQGEHDRMVEEAQASYDMAMRYRHPWFVGELAYWQWRGGVPGHVPDTIAEPYSAQMTGDASRAAGLWEQLGCPYEQAIALSDSANEDDLLHALQILIDLDAAPAIALVQQKLRHLGSDRIPRGPRESTRANPVGLTNRQLHVLELMADGLTNSEIADRLFISPKTVEHHISTILAKLNVKSRREAAIFAQENDLFDQK